MSKIKLLQGDCLELMKNIPDKSIDLIATDPPYDVSATNRGGDN
jgi:site-specific DNA-methyltransferase (adenine-specific)